MAMDGSPSSSTASSGWVLAIFTASVTEPRSDCFKTNLLVTRAEVFIVFLILESGSALSRRYT